PLSTRQPLVHDVPPVDGLEQIDDLPRGEGRQDRRLDARPAKMSVGFPRDALDVSGAQLGHRGAKLASDDLAPNTEWRVPDPPDPLPEPAGGSEAQPLDSRDRAAQRGVLRTMG